MRVKLPLAGWWLAVFLLAMCVWFVASKAADRLSEAQTALGSDRTRKDGRVSRLRRLEYAALFVMLTTMVAGVYVSA